MHQLQIINHKGQLLVDSREVAEMTGKQHKDLLRDIRNYVEILTGADLRSLDFFIEGTYEDGKGEKRPCYLLTRMGCDMVANKMTGEKGVLFTAAYVSRFNEMERLITTPYSGLSKELQAIFVLDAKTQEFEKRLELLEDSTTIDYGQQQALKKAGSKRVIGILGGKESPAYQNRSLRDTTYSTLWGDYHEYFNVNSKNNTARKDLERAKEFVDIWRPPGKLLREIELVNQQTTF